MRWAVRRSAPLRATPWPRAGDGRIARRELGLDRDVWRQRRREQVERFGDDRLRVDPRPSMRSRAAERQNAVDEHFGASARMHYLVDMTSRRSSFGQIVLCELSVAEDRAEDVVEVVSDAACERSDRFHFLRLPQLRFDVAQSTLAGIDAPQLAHQRGDEQQREERHRNGPYHDVGGLAAPGTQRDLLVAADHQHEWKFPHPHDGDEPPRMVDRAFDQRCR